MMLKYRLNRKLYILWGFMPDSDVMPDTLTEKIEGNFDKVRLKKTAVAVPALNMRKSRRINKIRQRKRYEIPTSVLVAIILRAAAEKRKEENKKKEEAVLKQYLPVKDQRPLLLNSGYGTVSRHYGSLIKTPYIDYGRLFSYLGNFRSKGAFEELAETPTQLANRVLEQGNRFYFIDREVIDSGIRTLKYFTPGAIVGEINTVPVGVNSADWEQFKLWQKLDPVMFNLKMNIM